MRAGCAVSERGLPGEHASGSTANARFFHVVIGLACTPYCEVSSAVVSCPLLPSSTTVTLRCGACRLRIPPSDFLLWEVEGTSILFGGPDLGNIIKML